MEQWGVLDLMARYGVTGRFAAAARPVPLEAPLSRPRRCNAFVIQGKRYYLHDLDRVRLGQGQEYGG